MRGVYEREILKLRRRQLYPRGRPMDHTFLVERRSLMDKKTPVASIGSCFASHVKGYLVREGFNYVQTSDAPGSQIGSAAWGTVYNTFCIAQEFRRAAGDFKPSEVAWADGKGGLLDPYRKDIGWPNREAGERERERHAKAARRALETARVFIVTAGLTEVWYSLIDGSVFFQVPPTKVFDGERHAFRASSVEENASNLRETIRILKRLSPDCRVILTVSPVPLRATFRQMNVITANALSKGTLLAAVDRVVASYDWVHYFPSYEIVTTIAADPFKADNRHVRPGVIERVMDAFVRSFVR